MRGGTIGRVPVTTITIDLTAHPRRFLYRHRQWRFCISMHRVRYVQHHQCAVDRIAVCSPIIDNGVCNIASVAVPASLPSPYRSTPRLSTWCTAIGFIVDTPTRSTSASGPANIANVLRRRRQYWPRLQPYRHRHCQCFCMHDPPPTAPSGLQPRRQLYHWLLGQSGIVTSRYLSFHPPRNCAASAVSLDISCCAATPSA